MGGGEERERVVVAAAARTLSDAAVQDTGRSLDTHLNIPVEIAVGPGENIGAEGLFGLHADNRETTTRMLEEDIPHLRTKG